IRQLPRRRDSSALSLHRTARNRLNTGMTCPLSEPDMRPLLPLSPSILALCFGLFAMTAQAEPTVHIRLDGQPLQPSWEMLGDDRFAAELDLQPGQLVLGARDADSQPLKPFQRHELDERSRFDFSVTEPGRYRLLVQTGEGANLRLLPIRQKEAATETVCQPWNGEALDVPVAGVFADGQRLRDGYSGQTAVVSNGRISLTPAPDSGGLLLLEADGAAPEPAHDWRNANVYFVLTDRFANGDPGNDRSYGREPDGEEEIGTFHGGDLKGLTG